MKRNLSSIILTILLLCLAPITTLAEDVEIDGIMYELINKAKQAATVISKEINYSGDIVIPSSIEYGGIEYSVTSIGNRAFYGCSGLTSVDIPNSVTSIGSRAFYECRGLSFINIPISVTSIGSEAFRVSGLTSIDIPNSVTSIGDYAFAGCSKLTSVTIPNSVTSIGFAVFSSCDGLSSVTIPNSVTSIGGSAFSGCTALSSVTIPNSVTNIGDYAFESCSSLTSVHISDIAAWCRISFGKYKANPLFFAHHLYLNDKEIKDLNIPNSVTSIGKEAFYGCSSMTSVTIPNSVISIGNGAFSDCSGLTSVTISNSVTSIGDFAFSYCSSLTSVDIPNSVTNIGQYAFFKCISLTSVTIGNGIQSIGSSAFANCSDLESLTIHATSIPKTTSDAFSNSYIDYATLMVPDESIDAYKSTEPWSNFGTINGISGTIVEKEKCATPTIHYADGKLTFECETEGATCNPTVTKPEVVNVSNNEMELGTIYKVSVYAAKPGYEDSDVATAEINMAQGSVGGKFDVNNDGEINITDALIIINFILGRYD